MTILFTELDLLAAREFARRHLEASPLKHGRGTIFLHSEEVAGYFHGILAAIAYLHDVVEDSDVTLDVITDIFGPTIGKSVDALTRREGERYFDYIRRLMLDPHARAVKVIDILVKLDTSPDSLKKRYIKALRLLHGVEK